MSARVAVLYAEDDENDAFFMQRAFAKLKRPDALRIVPSGTKVLAYLEGEGEFAARETFPLPEMVLLDVKMPEMSGLEALAKIRERREFDALPLVMFTSSTQESDIAFSREHGANGYFVKPSNADHLFRLIHTLLGAIQRIDPQSPRLPVEGNLL
jgi:CheY-like chemotaxis protein